MTVFYNKTVKNLWAKKGYFEIVSYYVDEVGLQLFSSAGIIGMQHHIHLNEGSLKPQMDTRKYIMCTYDFNYLFVL